jgi:hypothetical protein
MLGWAQRAAAGHWFTLDHNGKHAPGAVRLAQRPPPAAPVRRVDGHCFLVQVRRLASYLQAGLLVPTEEEALTVRATRDALAKLDANPERLLQ